MLIFQLVYSESSENIDSASLRLFCVTDLFNALSVDVLHKNNSLSCQGKYPPLFFFLHIHVSIVTFLTCALHSWSCLKMWNPINAKLNTNKIFSEYIKYNEIIKDTGIKVKW